jgi:hypothetical protein
MKQKTFAELNKKNLYHICCTKSTTLFGRFIDIIFQINELFDYNQETHAVHTQLMFFQSNKDDYGVERGNWILCEVNENGDCYKIIDSFLLEKILKTKPKFINCGEINDIVRNEILSQYHKEQLHKWYEMFYWKIRCFFMCGGYPLYRSFASAEIFKKYYENFKQIFNNSKGYKKIVVVFKFIIGWLLNKKFDLLAKFEKRVYKWQKNKVKYCVEGTTIAIIEGQKQADRQLISTKYQNLLFNEGLKIENFKQYNDTDRLTYYPEESRDQLMEIGASEIIPSQVLESHLNCVEEGFEVFKLVG